MGAHTGSKVWASYVYLSLAHVTIAKPTAKGLEHGKLCHVLANLSGPLPHLKNGIIIYLLGSQNIAKHSEA
jgi:hypothetical protein